MRAPLATVVLLTIGSAGRSSHAAPARVGIAIACPGLDADARAALEARARADLVLERVSEGTVVIACGGTTARITWRPSVGPPREGTASLPGDRAGAVDALLEGVHTVLVEVAATTSPPPAGADTAVAAPLPAPTPSVAPREPAGPASEATLAPVTDAPRASGTGPTTARAPSRWQVVAGVRSELWSGGIAAALGAQGGVRVVAGGPWRVAALAGPSWGTTSAGGIDAWSFWSVARVELIARRHWEVSLGAELRMLWASASAQTFAQSRLEGTTGGAVLGAAYVTSLGPIELAIRPSLEGLLRPVIVQVDQQEVFRVPTLVPTLSVEGSTARVVQTP